MKPARQVLIWQGRLHLGGKPGTFGDAAYAGLGVELPVMIHATPGVTPTSNKVQLFVRADHLQTYPPYPGHKLDIISYEGVAGSSPPRWTPSTLLSMSLPDSGDEFEFELDLTGKSAPLFLGVSLQVDTSVTPGFYNDFVLTRLSLLSGDFAYFATFGFE